MAIVKKKNSLVWISSNTGCNNTKIDEVNGIKSVTAINGENQNYLSTSPYNTTELNCGSSYNLFSNYVFHARVYLDFQ